jgi:hypothetical protein
VDGNGRVPQTVEEEGGLLPKGDVIKSGLLESGMANPARVCPCARARGFT